MKLAMWVFMLVCNLIVPAVMFFFGRRFLKKPPMERNNLYGYRTTRSMRNQETWDFAQRRMGEVWRKTGLVMLPLAVLGQALTLLAPTAESMCLWSLVPTSIEVVALATTIFPVERALKRNFDENGNRQ